MSSDCAVDERKGILPTNRACGHSAQMLQSSIEKRLSNGKHWHWDLERISPFFSFEYLSLLTIFRISNCLDSFIAFLMAIKYL